MKLTKETKRDRRLLDASEEARLLACASPHLRDVMRAAIATAVAGG